MMTTSGQVVIGDIGGTNARFAMVDLNGICDRQHTDLYTHQQTLSSKDYSSFTDAIQAYLANIPVKPSRACFAIAGPVLGDQIKMTNNHWQFSRQALQAQFDLQSLEIINDFQAPAYAILEFKPDDVVCIGPACTPQGQSYGVIGPGTGTGVGGLIQIQTSQGMLAEALNTEGGHISFAPTTARQIQILEVLQTRFSRVSVERLLSGMGIHNLYEALCIIDQQEPENLDIATIVQRGINHRSRLCTEAMQEFCAILGAQAGDLALTLGARAGIYIAGGIVPRFTEFLAQSRFRASFEDKGRHADYVKAIPTSVITVDQPGLLGTAAYVKNHSDLL